VNPFEGKEITLKPDSHLYNQLRDAVISSDAEKVKDLLSAGMNLDSPSHIIGADPNYDKGELLYDYLNENSCTKDVLSLLLWAGE
jgi:hypothetical protein